MTPDIHPCPPGGKGEMSLAVWSFCQTFQRTRRWIWRTVFIGFLLVGGLLPAQGQVFGGAGAAGRDLTFIVTSDVHYDAFENEDRNERNSRTLREMNAITNRTWPAELGGGRIPRPRGVLVLGDVIDDGDRELEGKHQSPVQYDWFLGDFGLDGTDGLLSYPVFETWGNHDGPPPGKEKFGFSYQARLKQRNLLRQQKGWVAKLSANGLHYSLDWEGVHIVMLGIYPADEQNPLLKRYSAEWHNPQGALAFLKEDLAQCVGASGRPVILASHCGFDTDWWHTNDWQAVYEAAKPYNVILYFYGHTGTGLKSWKPPGEERPWQCVNTGQTEKGFFVVQIQAGELRLAYRMKTATSERTPDKKTVWTWDGKWEWRHPLRKEFRAP
jgi:cytolysin (calcineurin-like family phosphatase)